MAAREATSRRRGSWQPTHRATTTALQELELLPYCDAPWRSPGRAAPRRFRGPAPAQGPGVKGRSSAQRTRPTGAPLTPGKPVLGGRRHQTSSAASPPHSARSRRRFRSYARTTFRAACPPRAIRSVAATNSRSSALHRRTLDRTRRLFTLHLQQKTRALRLAPMASSLYHLVVFQRNQDPPTASSLAPRPTPGLWLVALRGTLPLSRLTGVHRAANPGACQPYLGRGTLRTPDTTGEITSL